MYNEKFLRQECERVLQSCYDSAHRIAKFALLAAISSGLIGFSLGTMYADSKVNVEPVDISQPID